MVDVRFTFVPPRLDHSKVAQAISRGINEGGDLVRTRVVQQLRDQTGVRLKRSILSRVQTIRAHPGSQSYEILAKAKPIPLPEFDVSVNGKGVEADTWGVAHQFKRSFVLNGRYVARTGSGHFPIRRLLGPSLAKELHSEAVLEVFGRASAQFVPAAVVKHIARALG